MHHPKDIGKDLGEDPGRDPGEDSDGDTAEEPGVESGTANPVSGAAVTRRPTGPPRPPARLEPAHWQSLHELLADMDNQIAGLYRRRGITDVRPRFVGPLILLARHGPLTISELAGLTGRTHSALSQTVAALRKQGLVQSGPGVDARTRRVSLRARSRELVPLMQAEWHATEEAVRQIEREIPYPLTQVVADIRRALEQRSFTDRVADQLPDEGQPPQA